MKVIADQNAVRLWLITMDDNSNAVRFYENRRMTRAFLRAIGTGCLHELADAWWREIPVAMFDVHGECRHVEGI